MLRFLPYQQNDLVQTMTLFLTRHKWLDIVLLCDVNPSLGNFFTVACQGFQDGILQMPGTNLMSYNFDTRSPTDYGHYLTLGSLRSRIFVIVAHGNITRDIMIQAHKLKMTNGDYVYITTYPLEHPLYGFYKWRFEDENDDAAREAFLSLYFVSTRPLRGPDYRSFEVELKYRAYKDYQFMYAADERVSAFTALQHTVVTFTGDIINETLAETGVINDGKTIMQKAFALRNVSSVTGDFMINNGDRVQYIYVIVGMQHHTYTFREYFEYDTTVRKLARTPGQRLEWAYRQDAPPNTPFCGFDGSDVRCSNALSITVGIICGLIAAALILGLTVFCVAKHTKSDVELDDPRWSIPRDEINFLNLQSNMSASQTASRNIGSTVAKSQYSLRTGLNSQVSGSRVTKGTRGSGMTNSVTKDAHVAKWKNKLVWVHEIKLSHKFSPSGAQEDLIRKMKRINGPNLAHFYGFSPHDGVEMGVLCEIVARGSMTDLMASDKVKFDMALKNSVIRDLTNGLMYLHDSLVGHHGDVNCGNCLLDNRFVLKLAYYRLDFLPRATPSSLDEDNEYRQFLCFAPEQLRAPITHIFRGSKEADVYSYGHTLYNLAAEVEPFEEEMTQHNFTPKVIVDKVITQSIIAFRPRIPNGMDRTLRTIIEQCWDDKPLNRPTMKAVDRLLNTIPGFQRDTNFVDSLLQRMSQYAEELENRIAAATAGMIEEKKKSEELLFQVLPRHLALALTQGRKIEPESFSAVTIGFTAIANFGDIALQSTPMQIVDLLNDLYSMFDATLELFNVYKVETISDSYMIASGLPERNGDEHSRQIAKVSLELMAESDNFKIRHRPNERLQLKIGFHTGACAAGIVGSKMPRYCLFGDTINTASRMTSFGKALKIHVSTSAKEHLDRFKEFRFSFRGLVEIKGKGQQPCYWLLQKHEQDDGQVHAPQSLA
ncbi:hypothetical protein RvY_08220 [Ramazzottius varieornatus]|uniref:guanylate cyclase n=1 Tax=Ramazzottius varieornatus TaxID=947166 RepID=A0A1D1V9U8_RAMVA|nr:hypothetical protein RvY_08220 [Ramazzottius varieornatus]